MNVVVTSSAGSYMGAATAAPLTSVGPRTVLGGARVAGADRLVASQGVRGSLAA